MSFHAPAPPPASPPPPARPSRGTWGIVLGFLLLLVIFFWPIILGGRSLVPFDIPFATDPAWASLAAQMGIQRAQNSLVADLILENYVWKQFIRESLQAGILPLWNPYIFAGVPFLAAGQHSALYPLSLLYYLLPLWRAFGVFTVIQIWLAGLFMFFFLRILGVRRFGALLAGLVYMLSGLMWVNVVFPMLLGAMSWLPLLLAGIEGVVATSTTEASVRWLPTGRRLAALVGISLVVGIQFLAGHIEISYYILLVAAFYTLWRGLTLWRQHSWSVVLPTLGGLAGAVIVGIALAAVQLIPLYELASQNFRQGSASLQEVLGWAYPSRQIVAFLIPDFFGNPAHQRVFDIFARRWVELPGTTEWGIKNYVEGTAYVGILPLVLAGLAVLFRRDHRVWFFVVLAGLSLLFAFGTPVYALLYYGLPGLSQVHTPFRWVFPYTVSIAVLAGLGADWLAHLSHVRPRSRQPGAQTLVPTLGGLLLLAGLGVLGGLVGAYLVPQRALPLAERVMQMSQKAGQAFGDPGLFLSYQMWNVGLLGIWLIGAGLVLALWRWNARLRGIPIWQMVAPLVIVADLWAMGHDFYPRVEPALHDYTPPVVRFLQEDPTPYRIATYGPEHLLWPNIAMAYHIADIRGYDSIIPRSYTEYMRALGAEDLLLYNRIGPLSDEAALSSPRLDLLNVKYLLSMHEISHPDFRQVFEDHGIRVFEHLDALPRTFVVRALPETSNFDRVEQDLQAKTEVIRDRVNEILIAVQTAEPGYLVLTDSYFPGWRAFVTPAGTAEQEVEITRAFDQFRAVAVPAGTSTVRFKYFPMSLKVGIFVSFLAAMILWLATSYGLWNRFYRAVDPNETAQVIAKNSLVPMGASLVNKGIDFAFAMLMLRVLGPGEAGKYYFAIVVIGFADIFTNFGLNLLLTREVAKKRSQANRYLSNTAVLRLGLWLVALPLLGSYIFFRQMTQPLDSSTIVVLGLLTLSLIPSNLSAALSSLFTAYEQMEVPAAIATVTTLLKVMLGAAALLLGYGIIGLAGVSVITSTITLLIFWRLATRRFFVPRFEFDRAFVWQMAGIAAPLMLNHLLQTVFFKMDVVILDQFWSETVVGWYSTAYKWIDALLIIPAYFTMAIFPLMSRQAESDRAGLRNGYVLALRLLWIVAVPIAMATVFLAESLISILGGSAFLPHGANALRIMIWFLPLSFVNGVTQYVLIAIDQQRWITISFALATGFNLLANLLLIPRFGYPAAALVTIASEVVLFIPFYRSIRRHLGPLPLLELAWRPILGAAGLGMTMWLLQGIPVGVALVAGGAVYLLALFLLGTFTAEDRALLARLLPARFKTWRPLTRTT